VGIVLDEFYLYLGGFSGVRRHLDVCRVRLDEVSESCGLSPVAAKRMAHLLACTENGVLYREPGHVELDERFDESRNEAAKLAEFRMRHT